jgi:uncharacterized DUF497 family protein
MDVTFDPVKRETTLKARGLDFADAPKVFAGPVFEYEDSRFDYGEEIRMISVGLLHGIMVVIVWTDRGGVPHIISMRRATKGETDEYYRAVG